MKLYVLNNNRTLDVLEIHFTKLTKQTKVRSSASLYILHPDVLCKRVTRRGFMNTTHSKALLQNTLEHTFAKYTFMSRYF